MDMFLFRDTHYATAVTHESGAANETSENQISIIYARVWSRDFELTGIVCYVSQTMRVAQPQLTACDQF